MVVLKLALYTLTKSNSALERFQQFLLNMAVVLSLNYNAIPRSWAPVCEEADLKCIKTYPTK